MMTEKIRRADGFPESQIVKIWQSQLLHRTDLVTEEGEPIRIVYPGRLSDDGPDILDAVIGTSRGLIKGDIEFHVKSSSWRAHQHHQNPTYNRVILHVVFWHNTGATTNLQNGEVIPTLALFRFLHSPADRHASPRCSRDARITPCHKLGAVSNPRFIGEFLDSAGEARFLAKAARFRADLARTEAKQALYQGIMGALGYAKNQLPFLKLAQWLPLQTLESAAQSEMPDMEYLACQQARLLGTAGLLPSQRPNWQPVAKAGDEWADRLQRVWAAWGQSEVMAENDWLLSRVRPNNSPTRRIAAMSYLLLRYREKGILAGMVNKLKEIPANTGCHELEKALVVTADGYWASHLAPGISARAVTPTLLGSRRAADIIVNVLLPFSFAWGQRASQPELASKALGIYRQYPRLAVNAVERHMANQLGLTGDTVDSAQRQQGLLHVYKTRCSQGECDGCPIVEC